METNIEDNHYENYKRRKSPKERKLFSYSMYVCISNKHMLYL